MHKLRFLTSLIVLCVALVGCDRLQKAVVVEKVVAPETHNTVKIGFLASGSRVTYPNGAEIAVSEINARGGLLGMPVEIVRRRFYGNAENANKEIVSKPTAQI